VPKGTPVWPPAEFQLEYKRQGERSVVRQTARSPEDAVESEKYVSDVDEVNIRRLTDVWVASEAFEYSAVLLGDKWIAEQAQYFWFIGSHHVQVDAGVQVQLGDDVEELKRFKNIAGPSLGVAMELGIQQSQKMFAPHARYAQQGCTTYLQKYSANSEEESQKSDQNCWQCDVHRAVLISVREGGAGT
jgi:hypothetical protein